MCLIWTLTKNGFKPIQDEEMNFLRSVAGYILRDGKRNYYIKKELTIFSINDKIHYRNKWKDQFKRAGRIYDCQKGLAAVSYTHLDVYKRQAFDRTFYNDKKYYLN